MKMLSNKQGTQSFESIDGAISECLAMLQTELGVTMLQRQEESSAEQRAAFARMEAANDKMFAELQRLGGLSVRILFRESGILLLVTFYVL
jgi:hypothetical protein